MSIKAIPYYRNLLAYALTYGLPFFTLMQRNKVKAQYEGTKVIETIDWGNDSGIHPDFSSPVTDSEGAE